jgi:hypothetical protein
LFPPRFFFPSSSGFSFCRAWLFCVCEWPHPPTRPGGPVPPAVSRGRVTSTSTTWCLCPLSQATQSAHRSAPKDLLPVATPVRGCDKLGPLLSVQG